MKRKSKSKIKEIERRVNQLAKKYLTDTLDDLSEGAVDPDIIRYYCVQASIIIQKKFRNSAPDKLKLMNMVCRALTGIGQGQDPNTAFGLGKTGRKKNYAADDRMIALLVYRARLAGQTIKDACSSTYEYLIRKNLGRGLSYERVRAIYYKHRDNFILNTMS